MKYKRVFIIPFVLILCSVFTASSQGFDSEGLSKGQIVYVSVYSNILTAPQGIPFSLDATLIIRNTDMSNTLKVTTIDFYNTEGKVVKQFLDSPMILQPLETKHIYLPAKGIKGGIGANFIIRWFAERVINTPIIECLMIGTRSSQGISFVVSGKVIQENIQ